jgi:hypothetical protein
MTLKDVFVAVPTGGRFAVGVSAAVVVPVLGDGKACTASEAPGAYQNERQPPAAGTPAAAGRSVDQRGQAGDDSEDLDGGGESVEQAERFPHP